MSHSKMLTTRRRKKRHLKELAVKAKLEKKVWSRTKKIGAAGKTAS